MYVKNYLSDDFFDRELRFFPEDDFLEEDDLLE